MRITFFDLETSPVLGYVWRAYEDNLLGIEKDFGLLAFSYKIDDGKIVVVSRRTMTERQLVKALWKLLNEAEVVCAQNGDRFDIKVSNALFIRYGLKPPAPYKSIDTLKIAKRYFKFTQNKLDYLATHLLGEAKIATNSSLWFKCMKGDVEALKEMEVYCMKDVDLLYRVYLKLQMWHTGHPNSNVYNGTTHQCPNCGGNTQKRGFMLSRTGKWQRHQCTACGAWSKGEKLPTQKVIS